MSSVFRIGGIASGIDFNQVIDQLMALERKPVGLLEDKKQLLSWKKDFWSDLQTTLNTFNTSIGALLKKSTMMARTTTSTDSTIVTADATSDAALGTYSVNVIALATSTKVTSGGGASGLGISGTIDPTKPISSYTSKFNNFPTAGTFTVNGITFTLSDTNADTSIDQVVVSNGSSTILTYNSTDTSGNLTFNELISNVFNDASVSAATGVTASYSSVTDKFSLTATAPGGNLNLGSGGDTSNFLSAVGLLNAIRSGDTKTSTFHLGMIRTSQMLSSANFATAITGDASGNGSFTINGVTITYNINTDTLQNVIDRINSSAAGVTASFDSLNDRLVLTNKSTGSLSITRANGSNPTDNFLTATNLLSGTATDTVGTNARFTIDGGSELNSLSNDVSGTITGVTFHLLKVGTASLTISQDNSKVKAAIKDFVDKYNATVTLINTKLNEQPIKDPKTLLDKKTGLMYGDMELANMKYDLVYKATSAVAGLSSTLDQLAEIGITITSDDFGKSGMLVLDEAKLDAALNSNPSGVASLFFSDTNGNGKIDTGEDGVAARLSTYMNLLISKEGTLTVNRTEDNLPGAIIYAGTWSSVPDLNASGGNYTKSSVPGDSATFTFTGSAITWYATKDSTMGTAEVWVDGVYKQDVNLNSASTQYKQAVYSIQGLSNGSHTIQIKEKTGSAGPINIDALDATFTNSSGVVLSEQDELQSEMSDIDKQVIAMNERLDKREETLVQQFTAMELAIARLQQMQGRLAAQLGVLNSSSQ